MGMERVIISLLNSPYRYEPLARDETLQGLQISAQSLPAYGDLGGGDWCEAFAVSSNMIALSIGDVCGHGIEKFSTMLALRQIIRSLAYRGVHPAQIMAEVNTILCEDEEDIYATAIFALFDIARSSLTLANVGHPAPVLATAQTVKFVEHGPANLMLGVTSRYVPTFQEVQIPQGSLLVFYTDGIIENQRLPLDGSRHLLEAVLNAYTFHKQQFAKAITKLMFLGEMNRDDAAVLTLFSPSI